MQSSTGQHNLGLQNYEKRFIQAISYSEFKEQRAVSVDLDEVALDELPHKGLLCLQVQMFLSLAI